ncbi:lysozyme inhibitor LprI family protein [Bacillus sp. FJAT-22090]|uniref:lysozyme inhibitor LprI family protein n=1 Tax=Bacillus sp. FJAT-22090 TaxID=1581038 RepID=UPI00119D004E|nr:lysozyme inhibitor LprI family protein [Bacillus sp. FJAT-22090]
MKKLLVLFIIPFIFLAGCNHTEEQSVEKENAENGIASNENTESNKVENKKNEYLEKLNAIEKGLSEFDEVYKNGTQTDMNQAKAETFKRWDDALNEIYSVLQKQLSASEMEKLREEQREWIKHRNKIATEESSEFKGGTLEPFQFADTQARVTKERCYELVEIYMK